MLKKLLPEKSDITVSFKLYKTLYDDFQKFLSNNKLNQSDCIRMMLNKFIYEGHSLVPISSKSRKRG
jgi:antitoxin component of RelBE/YafQ-DinJ toxin-antitoxin module